MNNKPTRVCVIGAGPSGMSALYNFARLNTTQTVDVVCYEKQADWGGQWNFTWRTGTDEFGEPVHSSMYRHLWINAPKECSEFPDYTFDQHFGQAMPSYLPRAGLRGYLEGRWQNCGVNLKKNVQFNTTVRNVEYNSKTDELKVRVENQLENTTSFEMFDYIIVAAGIFSTPNVPDIPGIENFPGRVLHCHNFRDAREFVGQRVLIVGSSFSAEDVALHCQETGAKNIIISWRTKEIGFDWPKGIEERPLVQKIDGNTALFKDGTSAEIDAVIFCTGYIFHHPYLAGDLRLDSDMSFYPENLYKGIVWLKGGNNRVLYIGAQVQFYTFPMFDIQAAWVVKYITGQLTLPGRADMFEHVDNFLRKRNEIRKTEDGIDFQTDYVEDLIHDVGYCQTVTKANPIFHSWLKDKRDDFKTFRDQAYNSLYTGTKATVRQLPYVQIVGDNY